MAVVNVYKIIRDRHEVLKAYLDKEYVVKGKKELNRKHLNSTNKEELEEVSYIMTLYIGRGTDPKTLTWNWILSAFGTQEVTIDRAPKAIVLIEVGNLLYAITFGHSYYKIDQFSDKEWAFNFARRLNYLNVRTLAITNPNSKRNRTVNTYLDYENLDLGSGEALTKLKAKILLPEDFNLFSNTLEIGNSIRLTTKKENLENIADIVNYIENTITYNQEIVKIPYFKLVKDEVEINKLKELMKNDIETDPMMIDFSEYQIHATRIVFSDNHEYELKYREKRKKYDGINYATVKSFIEEFKLNERNDLLDINVVVWVDGKSEYTTSIENLIFYTNDNSNSLLSDGSWYVYNEDYLQYLNDSISEIPVEYEEKFNYSKKLHEQFVEKKFQEERQDSNYKGLKPDEIRKKIKQKYYKERYYNDWLVEQDKSYANFDRDLQAIGKHKVEVMDIYRSNEMFAVKFGSTSSKLCYAVDQSLEAIRAYHRGEIVKDIVIENVYLWLVLERKELPLLNGKPDINQLNLLILKNKLDQWKKEVRLLGYRPVIKINYSRE
ncbi:DUF6119 family protein [Paenibacillus sp. FSL M8-0334]|uniref:DUF6119 family protein n=1 Tax=Paenibacillus sp. FSL M8-0334 TaxID=2921623 RepID=UPI0030FB733F